jgi:hypothetical protein
MISMEAALQAFLITVAIVGGILSPFILILLIQAISNAMQAAGQAMINAAEEIKRQPPFEDVEVNVSPATRVMTMRFIKGGKTIWQGSATQNANDDKLTIESEPINDNV